MIKKLLNWILGKRLPVNNVRKKPSHYIYPKKSHWLPPLVAILLLTLPGSAATVRWGVKNVMKSGTPVSQGLALLVLGTDTATTEAAIKAGTFSMAGAKTISNGAASGKLTAPPTKTGYVYLVMTYDDQYSISQVITTKIPGKVTFSGATWQDVPEPGTGGLALLGALALLTRRKGNYDNTGKVGTPGSGCAFRCDYTPTAY